MAQTKLESWHMSDKPPTPEEMAAFQAAALQQHAALEPYYKKIERVAGFRLSEIQRRPFLDFRDFIKSDPQPAYIAKWLADSPQNRWYQAHTNGLLGHTQESLACAHYHAENLIELEAAVTSILRGVSPKFTTGGGNTRRITFEYQAFVLAVRRCLDHMTLAFAAYFQQTFHSFRRIPKSLNRFSQDPVAAALIAAHARSAPDFEYVLSDGVRKSTRDRITHWESVDAGVLNIAPHGVFLAGGGEELSPRGDENLRLLSKVIRARIAALQSCVALFVSQFTNAYSAKSEDGE